MTDIRPEDEVVTDLPGADPHRHIQLRRRLRPGRTRGRRIHRRADGGGGLDAEIFESAPAGPAWSPGMAGEDPSASALVVHGHLDVVPALREQWSVDPFGGELKDGLIWGRGAVDMKDMDAMILSVLRNFARTGPQAQAGPHLCVLRRRGSRRHVRRPLRRRQAARTLRGRHGGDLGGRRLFRHHRRPAHLPAADGGKGPVLAPPRGPRPRGPRLPDQHRQRRDPAGRRGLADR